MGAAGSWKRSTRLYVLLLYFWSTVLLFYYSRIIVHNIWLHGSSCTQAAKLGKGWVSLFLSVLLLTRFSALRVEYVTETQFHAWVILTNTTILLGALALYSRIWNNSRTVAVCTNGKITRSARSLFENLEQLYEPWRCVQMAKLLGALALYSRIWNIHKNQGFVSRFCEGSDHIVYRAQGPIDRACV